MALASPNPNLNSDLNLNPDLNPNPSPSPSPNPNPHQVALRVPSVRAFAAERCHQMLISATQVRQYE